MGEAKRRKALDPNYGKQRPAPSDWVNGFDSGCAYVRHGGTFHKLITKAWDYPLTEDLVFSSMPDEQVPQVLRDTISKLPGKDSGLQVLPIKFGDSDADALMSALILYALKNRVPGGQRGIEHSVVKILIPPGSTGSEFAIALEDTRNFDHDTGVNGSVVAARYWEEYYIMENFQDRIDWDCVIPPDKKDYFLTDGWVHCSIECFP